MELVYSIKYIDNIAYWFAMAMLAKHNKAARMTSEKSHVDDETRAANNEKKTEAKKEKNLVLQTMLQCRFKTKPRATSWYAAKTFVPLLSPWMMLLMMIGLKLSRASHEHVTMNGIHVNITNAHTQKYTIKNDDVEKWYAFLLSACVTIATVWRYHSSCWADHSVLSFSSFFHRILDRLFYFINRWK